MDGRMKGSVMDWKQIKFCIFIIKKILLYRFWWGESHQALLSQFYLKAQFFCVNCIQQNHAFLKFLKLC
jgi:hypothetical protein